VSGFNLVAVETPADGVEGGAGVDWLVDAIGRCPRLPDHPDTQTSSRRPCGRGDALARVDLAELEYSRAEEKMCWR
jgi:hypothetical protein